MSEMIERVAEAIENELNKLADVENCGGFTKEFAIAAIKAMREPTEEMLQARYDCEDEDGYYVSGGTAKKLYQAMIYKALEE